MTRSTSLRSIFVSFLVAVCVHVVIFFVFVAMVAWGAFVVETDDEEEEEFPKEEKIEMQVVYEDPEEAVLVEEVPEDVEEAESEEEQEEPTPEDVEEPESEEAEEGSEEAEPEPEPEPQPQPEPVVEPEPQPEPESQPEPEVVVEPEGEEPVVVVTPEFVQTDESQEAELSEPTDLIGERNTQATSDANAVAGSSDLAALSGAYRPDSDVKTFDADFTEGENARKDAGEGEVGDSGQGEDELNEEQTLNEEGGVVQDEEQNLIEPEEVVEEELVLPEDDGDLASISSMLTTLEEALGEENLKINEELQELAKVEETMPNQEGLPAREAGPRDGGFAPQARKTRVAGVLSALGSGSLNVEKTPVGEYQAKILRKLETEWQIVNLDNRSLLAPGSITLYFAVNAKGEVMGQRQMARVGASNTQLGFVLSALDKIKISAMSSAVKKELDGEPLEIIVTFNY